MSACVTEGLVRGSSASITKLLLVFLLAHACKLIEEHALAASMGTFVAKCKKKQHMTPAEQRGPLPNTGNRAYRHALPCINVQPMHCISVQLAQHRSNPHKCSSAIQPAQDMTMQNLHSGFSHRTADNHACLHIACTSEVKGSTQTANATYDTANLNRKRTQERRRPTHSTPPDTDTHRSTPAPTGRRNVSYIDIQTYSLKFFNSLRRNHRSYSCGQCPGLHEILPHSATSVNLHKTVDGLVGSMAESTESTRANGSPRDRQARCIRRIFNFMHYYVKL